MNRRIFIYYPSASNPHPSTHTHKPMLWVGLIKNFLNYDVLSTAPGDLSTKHTVTGTLYQVSTQVAGSHFTRSQRKSWLIVLNTAQSKVDTAKSK